MMRTSCIRTALALALAAGLAGCGEEQSTGDNTPKVSNAQIRVVHASPDAPAVDVYVAGSNTPLFDNAAFGATTAYVTVPAGKYNLQLRAHGSPASSAPAFETGMIQIEGDVKTTAVAAGLLGSASDADKLRVLTFIERFGAPASGSARVRIIHASPDAPTVAVDVGNDGTPEIAGLARFGATSAEGVSLPAGKPLQIGLWAGSPAARVTAFTTPALPDGGELFVIATGRAAQLPRMSDGMALLAVAPSGTIGSIKQNPALFVLHGSPDAPPVDVFAGDLELADNLAFAGLTSPIQVPPGDYSVDVFAHAAGNKRPAGDAAFSAKTGALEPGERYLAIATGFLAPGKEQPGIRLLAVRDQLQIDDKNARVLAVHASPDAPGVDIGPVSGGAMVGAPLFSGVKFGDAATGAGVPVPPLDVTLGIAATGSQSPAAAFDIKTIAGQRLIAVAIGALAPAQGQQSFRLALVETQKWPWTVTSISPKQ